MKILKDVFMFWIPMLFLYTLLISSFIGLYYVYDWLDWAGFIKSYPFSSGVVG